MTALTSSCHENVDTYGPHEGAVSKSCRKCWKKTCEYHLALADDIQGVEKAIGSCLHCAEEITAS